MDTSRQAIRQAVEGVHRKHCDRLLQTIDRAVNGVRPVSPELVALLLTHVVQVIEHLEKD